MANQLGVRARASMISTREDTDFAMGVALLDPNENPFTLLTMDIGRETSRTIDYHWFEDELIPETDQVDNASDDYDASSTGIIVDDYTKFALGDVWMHNLSGETMLVTGINTGTGEITFVRDYGQDETGNDGWTALAVKINDNDYLSWVGNAFEQGHPLPTIRSTQLTEFKNYNQDQRTPTGITEIADAAAHRGEDDRALQLRKSGITHMRKLENQNLWGHPFAGDKGLYDSSVGNLLPTVGGGINHYLQEYAPANQKKDEDDLTQSEFQAWLEYAFEYGSSTKWMYCSPRLRTALDSWGISKLNTFSDETLYGMDVARWVSSHGTVIFVTHKMLKQPQSNAYHYNFLIDMEKLKWVTYSNIGATRLRKLRPYEATGATILQWEYQTISCIRFGLPACHGRLRFKTYS